MKAIKAIKAFRLPSTLSKNLNMYHCIKQSKLFNFQWQFRSSKKAFSIGPQWTISWFSFYRSTVVDLSWLHLKLISIYIAVRLRTTWALQRFGCWSSLNEASLKLRSSRSESNRRLRATCTKTAAHTWHADAIWKLLLFWPTEARRRRLDSDLNERSLRFNSQFGYVPKLFITLQ